MFQHYRVVLREDLVDCKLWLWSYWCMTFLVVGLKKRDKLQWTNFHSNRRQSWSQVARIQCPCEVKGTAQKWCYYRWRTWKTGEAEEIFWERLDWKDLARKKSWISPYRWWRLVKGILYIQGCHIKVQKATFHYLIHVNNPAAQLAKIIKQFALGFCNRVHVSFGGNWLLFKPVICLNLTVVQMRFLPN